MLELSNAKLLDLYEKTIRRSIKKPDSDVSLRLLEIRKEMELRMIEDDTQLFVAGKKMDVSPADIEKMPLDKIKERLSELQKKASSVEDFILVGLLHAQSVWLHYLQIRETEEFMSADEKEKSALFRDRFPEFFNKYPVITKYMIYRGVFSLKAFKQFLLQAAKMPRRPPSKEEKMQMWCDLRAHYVKNTWRDMHRNKHLSQRDFEAVYKEVYKKLMEDYTSFEEEKEAAKQAIEENEELYKKQTLEYLVNNFDNLDEESRAQADELLSDLVKKKCHEDVMKELLSRDR